MIALLETSALTLEDKGRVLAMREPVIDKNDCNSMGSDNSNAFSWRGLFNEE